MATYVVGDVQGCYSELSQLLAQVSFDTRSDYLWLAGDLVNRGPDNVSVLRFVKDLGERARVVLGNHDLHLLAVSRGKRKLNRKDTIEDVLAAEDRDTLLNWLRQQPLIHQQGDWVMSHAGVPHIWSVDEAIQLANEVHQALTGWEYEDYLGAMYGDSPGSWSNTLRGMDRLRLITNYFTRMRFIGITGELDLKTKEGCEQAPPGVRPWFVYPRKTEDAQRRFLFGHWAALEGKTGKDAFEALDTGCVWGGSLTMKRLDDGVHFRQESNNPQ